MKIALIIIGIILLLIGSMFAYALYNPNHEVKPQTKVSENDVEKHVNHLLKTMSLKDKLKQLAGDTGQLLYVKLGIRFGLIKQFCINYAGRDEKNGIQPIAFSDGPRGITVGPSTNFPVAMARAATWDTDLENRVGDVIGQEARAQNANYFGGVCINLLRHPGWGRAQESYGEDPWLMGKMGVAVTEGVQQHNVMACAKHFALNSIEDSRFYVDVKVDDRTLREVYLPHYQMVIDAGVASIMNAYNKVNGEYCGHNKWLLTDVLRNEMGFEGFVTSDWIWGIYDGVKAIKAGMDVEMPMEMHSGQKLQKYIDEGTLSTEDVDKCVKRVLETKLKYLTREDPMVYTKDLVANEEHCKLALEAAEKSMVLLKNENQLLPLDKKKLSKVAVIGQLATSKETGDKGSSYFRPKYVVTPLEGITNALSGLASVVYSDGTNPEELKATVADADAVIVVAGYGPKEEGEFLMNDKAVEGRTQQDVINKGGDRFSLTLLEKDENLIDQVSKLNENVVVSLVGGSAIICENWKDKVSSVIMAWYSGMEGGNALANIIFGDVNPSGKLPFTVPVSQDQLPNFDPFAKEVTYGYYHGYTLFDEKEMKPAYAFGHGLSYTTFSISEPVIEQTELTENDTLNVRVNIKNTGNVSGDEIVQLYIGFENSMVERPKKLLRNFKRVSLQPGESKEILLQVKAQDMDWYNPDTRKWEVEKMEYQLFVGNSSESKDLKRTSFIIN
ncbi:glycosyl hydrolase [Labilibacter sediminis]|nr:glycosyl hydrolase [Labilibacter sediminis]